MSIIDVLKKLQDEAAIRVRQSPGPCRICDGLKRGKGNGKNKRNICSECLMNQPHILALAEKVKSLHSQGFDDISGKPINRVPEFFHVLAKGKPTSDSLMGEPNERGMLVTPRVDETVARYGHVIKQGRKSRPQHPTGGGRPKRPILIDSNNPAFLLPGDAA